jgi:hypothetical protein
MDVDYDLSDPTNTSKDERDRQNRLKEIAVDALQQFTFDWNAASLVFARRQSISRILFYAEIYKQILRIPGWILEFGCREGSSLAIFTALRGIYEPYNFNRRVYGFDTLSGFPNVSQEDGLYVKESNLNVPLMWDLKLQEILSIHLKDSPLANLHVSKAIVGDVHDTWEPFIKENPHAVISLASFDMDLYQPTKYVLERVLDLMPKGAILLFDEFNTSLFPGETQAVKEVLGVKNLNLFRSQLNPTAAYVIL